MADPEGGAPEPRAVPPGETDAVLRQAAGDVADLAAVDWGTRASDSPEAAPLLDKLNLIERVARAFREAGPQAAAGTAPLRGDAGAPTDLTWRHLRLLSKLGEGSFGEVYRAYDPLLDHCVALKLSKSRPAEGSERRFLEEARRLARVRHPNVVVVHGAEVHDGRVGLWTDLVEGETLEELLARAGELEAREAARIGADVCAALAAVHAQGLVHGDVKAGNVMRGHDGRVVLMDFGTVKEVASGGAEAVVTRGTPLVLAPELLRGGAPTPAADLYSAGVLVYQLLTGRYPVEGATLAEVSRRHSSGESTPLRERRRALPADLVRAVEQALESDPRRRPAGAEDMRRRLAAVAAERPSRWQGPRAAMAASVLGIGLAIAGTLLPSGHGTAAPPPRTSVAVLGLSNLSGRTEAAWLATAVSEMLATELAAGEGVRVVRADEVERARIELGLAPGAIPPADALRRVRRVLGADLVVAGSYVAAEMPAGRLRLDIRLLETATGSTVLAVSEEGSQSELFDLVARTGTRLRLRLGGGASPPAPRRGGSMPSDTRAARLYALGLERLRALDVGAARLLLEQALDLEPGFAPAHAALASAWSTLGYEERAAEAARRAYELSGGLAREERLLVEARFRRYARQWDEAARIYRRLRALFPDEAEYGLDLAATLTSGGRPREAVGVIESLRRSPGTRWDDPRLDLAEATAAAALGDDRRAQAAAARAAEKGRLLSARLLLARARGSEAAAWLKLGEKEAALAAAAEARELSAELNDRSGLARMWHLEGNIHLSDPDLAMSAAAYAAAEATYRDIGHGPGTITSLYGIGLVASKRGDHETARRRYEEALALCRQQGNRRFEAHLLQAQGILMRRSGDLRAARANYEQALALARRVGDVAAVGEQLHALANIHWEFGDLRSAERLYKEALAGARHAGHRRQVLQPLCNLAGLRLLRGDPESAATLAEEAIELARRAKLGSMEAVALRRAAEVRLARADLGRARAQAEEAAAAIGGESGELARIQTVLGRVLAEQTAGAEAVRVLGASAESLRSQARPDDEAVSQAWLANALLDAGDTSAAREAVSRALALAAKSVNRETRLVVAVDAQRARVRMLRAACATARRALEGARDEARRVAFVQIELDARLALGEAEVACGGAATARARLRDLEAAARERGFLLVAGKARALAAGAGAPPAPLSAAAAVARP